MVSLKAYAKLNLCLSVLKKRDDGFHDLKSLIQTVDVFDRVNVQINNTGTVKVSMDTPDAIQMQKNSAYIAAKSFFEVLGLQDGADIYIQKNIPFCSGMGGSSADAGGVIAALSAIYNINHTDNRVRLAASKTGSDTVALLLGGLTKLTGKGDDVQMIDDAPKLIFVVALNNEGALTKTVFNQFDKLDGSFDHTRFDRVLENLNKNVENYIYNDLTEACLAAYPSQKKFVKDCYNAVKKMPTMTGSGSALFWIAKDELDAQNLCRLITKNKIKAFICRSVPFGFKIF